MAEHINFAKEMGVKFPIKVINLLNKFVIKAVNNVNIEVKN
jgi:hypothetical protein